MLLSRFENYVLPANKYLFLFLYRGLLVNYIFYDSRISVLKFVFYVLIFIIFIYILTKEII